MTMNVQESKGLARSAMCVLQIRKNSVSGSRDSENSTMPTSHSKREWDEERYDDMQ